MSRRWIELALGLAAGAAVMTSSGAARAQTCEGGTIEQVPVWQGMDVYQTQVAATGGHALVTWRAWDGNDWPTLSMRVAAIDAAGAPPIDEGSRPAATDDDDGLATLVAGDSVVLELGGVPYATGVRILSPAGSELGAVTYASYPQSGHADLRASFDGAHFLVTYAADDAAGQRTWYLSRLDDGGTPIDAAPIAIAPAGYEAWSQAVRIGTTTWMIWQRDEPTFDVVGVRIADDGTIVDPAPVVLGAFHTAVALAVHGEVAALIARGSIGDDVVLLGAAGPLGSAPIAIDVDDNQHAVRAITPSAGGDGFVLWVVDVSDAVFPADTGTLDAYAVTRAGAVASTPLFSTAGLSPSVAVDGGDYVVSMVAQEVSGTEPGATGHQRMLVRRFHADGAAAADSVIDDHPFQNVVETFCQGPGEPYAGCSAAGGGGAGGAVLIALAMLASRRRRDRR